MVAAPPGQFPPFFQHPSSRVFRGTPTTTSAAGFISPQRGRGDPRDRAKIQGDEVSFQDQGFLMDLYDLLGVFVHPSTKKDKPGFSQCSSR